MCSRIECPTCGRPGYRGCGAHVEQVLGGVPPAERCRCRDTKERKPGGKRPEAASLAGSWFRGLLGD